MIKEPQTLIEDITVKIRTIDHIQLDLRVPPTSTVHQIKLHIEKTLRIPIPRQRLIFRGRHLSNEDTLLNAKIEDQSVIQLVANVQEPEASPTLRGGLSTSSIDEQEIRQTVDVQENRKHTRRRVLQQRLYGFPNLPARPFPALHQNVLTLCHLLQSFNTLPESIEQGQIFAPKEFEVGMWVDFKDSCNEWVEALIQAKQQNQLLVVSQKGEEWLNWPSSRVAVFRSHTIQKSYELSPTQFRQNDAHVSNVSSFPELLGQTGMLLTRVGNMMSRLADSMEEKEKATKKSDMQNLISGMIEEQRRIQEEKVENRDEVTSLKSMKSMKSDKFSIDYETSSIKSMKSDVSKLTSTFPTYHATQLNENITEEEEDSQDMSDQAVNVSREIKENYAYYETALLSAQLAPLADRLGRLLTDLSPYLAVSGANISNVFQNNNNNNISNLSIITNEGSQYSTNAKQYFFQVPILLTPLELTQSSQASINRIISEHVDIINHLPRSRRPEEKKDERTSFQRKVELDEQYQQQVSSQSQQQYQQLLQQQQHQQQQQQQQQLSQQTQQPLKSKKKKQKEVSFSQQIDELKKQK